MRNPGGRGGLAGEPGGWSLDWSWVLPRREGYLALLHAPLVALTLMHSKDCRSRGLLSRVCAIPVGSSPARLRRVGRRIPYDLTGLEPPVLEVERRQRLANGGHRVASEEATVGVERVALACWNRMLHEALSLWGLVERRSWQHRLGHLRQLWRVVVEVLRERLFQVVETKSSGVDHPQADRDSGQLGLLGKYGGHAHHSRRRGCGR